VTSRLSIAQATVLVLLLSLCASAGPYQADHSNTSLPKHAIGTKQRLTDIPGFGEVTPHLYRGGQPGVKGMDALRKIGIEIVVDMRGGRNKKEEAKAHKLGMQYVSIPWHCPFPRDKTFAKFLKLIRQNSQKKVFVHCRLGDDRTGMAVAAYRMAEEGWSADEAMNEMKEFGFAGMHHVICPTLAHYEKTFPKRLKTSPAFKDLPPHTPSTTSK